MTQNEKTRKIFFYIPLITNSFLYVQDQTISSMIISFLLFAHLQAVQFSQGHDVEGIVPRDFPSRIYETLARVLLVLTQHVSIRRRNAPTQQKQQPNLFHCSDIIVRYMTKKLNKYLVYELASCNLVTYEAFLLFCEVKLGCEQESAERKV